MASFHSVSIQDSCLTISLQFHHGQHLNMSQNEVINRSRYDWCHNDKLIESFLHFQYLDNQSLDLTGIVLLHNHLGHHFDFVLGSLLKCTLVYLGHDWDSCWHSHLDGRKLPMWGLHCVDTLVLDWDPCSGYHLDLFLVLDWDIGLVVHLGHYWQLLLAFAYGWEEATYLGVALCRHLGLGLGSLLRLSLVLELGLLLGIGLGSLLWCASG